MVPKVGPGNPTVIGLLTPAMDKDLLGVMNSSACNKFPSTGLAVCIRQGLQRREILLSVSR